MIKTLITGGATDVAGELLRLLVHHPDVELKNIYSPENQGVDICKIHHGLIGDIRMSFSGTYSLDGIDVVFICSEDESAANVRRMAESMPGLRVVDLVGETAPDKVTDNDFVYGLSEVFRKPLVRGARLSVVPHVAEIGALVALYPLAAHLLLQGDLSIVVTMPVFQINAVDWDKCAERVSAVLRHFQRGWQGKLKFIPESAERESGLELKTELPCQLSENELLKVYDSIYDDHNFTFFSFSGHQLKEVIGTHKTLLGLSLENELLTIDLICDSRLRGGAGEAVHLMNLLFGLHEKTGLTLRASGY